ncbi:hypothetical protein ABVK25_001556 [Lepraria finkii]|uniref:Uncharacterized protein n=1 Tax=Lepraria finkii TaxID=1340010 RepID=A0ABR4BJE0_9LECA
MEIVGSASSLLETQTPKNESQLSDSKPINKASSAPSPTASVRSEPIIIDLEKDDLKAEDAKDVKQIKEENPSVQNASRVEIDKRNAKQSPWINFRLWQRRSNAQIRISHWIFR